VRTVFEFRDDSEIRSRTTQAQKRSSFCSASQ
jgi:hypothetical protein